MANIRRKNASPAEYSWMFQPDVFSARAGFAQEDQMSGRKVVNGGDKNDTLKGTAGNDKLDGKNGNDLIDGKGGNDTLIGGTGKNTISGGAGVDTVVLDGDAALWKAVHGDNGEIIFSRKGTVTTIDASVEFIRFKDGTINRTAPAEPDITTVKSAHGNLVDGQTTIDTTLVLNGTTDPFAVVVVTVDGVIAGNAQANGNGVWTLDLSDSPLDEGAHEIVATASLGLPGEEATSDTFDVTVGHVVDLTTLSAAQGFIIQGDTAGDFAGKSVSSAGDVNGDGFDDLIIGADGGDDGDSGAGEAYVIFGSDQGFGINIAGRRVIDLTTLTAAQGFVIQGDAASDNAGGSVSSAGDVNGDGFDDLIIGARGGDDGGSGAGEAYVVFGSDQGFGTNVAGRQVIDLTTITSAQGFIIQGDTAGDFAGGSVSSAGDVNGDGFDDLIVGALNGGGGVGEAYVIFGSDQGLGTDVSGRKVIDLTSLTAAQGFIIQGDQAGDLAGSAVSNAGDVNGDGFDDLIVGANSGGGGNEVYVVFGTDQGFGTDISGRKVIDLTVLSAAQGFVIQRDAGGGFFDASVSSAGDVDGDGFDDLIVGASDRADGGEAYVIFGTDQGFGTNVAGRQVIDIATLSATQGFVIQGDTAGDSVGVSVSSAGDVNGDGFGDLIVGANEGDDGGSDAGEAYVIFGSDQNFGTKVAGRQVIDLTTLTAAQGFIIQGDTAFNFAGSSVSSGGDVNGDGFDDLIVGASNGGDGVGEAYVIFGGTFGNGTAAVQTIGTLGAEFFFGGAGNDRLDGRGGADRFRAGSGDDIIRIANDDVVFIDAGLGQDTVALSATGITFDARDWSNAELSGVEAFDLTGTGDNTLILEASDMFHFSTTGNTAFSAAASHNSLVVLGNAGDTLELIEFTSSGAGWDLTASNKTLAGGTNGTFDLYNLVDGDGDVLASVAVDSDVSVIL
jgi:hypothetical protein